MESILRKNRSIYLSGTDIEIIDQVIVNFYEGIENNFLFLDDNHRYLAPPTTAYLD